MGLPVGVVYAPWAWYTPRKHRMALCEWRCASGVVRGRTPPLRGLEAQGERLGGSSSSIVVPLRSAAKGGISATRTWQAGCVVEAAEVEELRVVVSQVGVPETERERLRRDHREMLVVLRRRRSNRSPPGSVHPGYLNNHPGLELRTTRKRKGDLEILSARSIRILFGLVLRLPSPPKVWGEARAACVVHQRSPPPPPRHQYCSYGLRICARSFSILMIASPDPKSIFLNHYWACRGLRRSGGSARRRRPSPAIASPPTTSPISLVRLPEYAQWLCRLVNILRRPQLCHIWASFGCAVGSEALASPSAACAPPLRSPTHPEHHDHASYGLRSTRKRSSASILVPADSSSKAFGPQTVAPGAPKLSRKQTRRPPAPVAAATAAPEPA